MKNLLDTFKNAIKGKYNKKYYTAQMTTGDGSLYTVGIRGISKAEAYGNIMLNAANGCRILSIEEDIEG